MGRGQKKPSRGPGWRVGQRQTSCTSQFCWRPVLAPKWHSSNEYTSRHMEVKKEKLPYTQTDGKADSCCRMPRLADININHNIQAQSSVAIHFKQNPVERVGLWCETWRGILENEERIRADDPRLSTQGFFLSHITWSLSTPRCPVAPSAGFQWGVPWPVTWARKAPGPSQATPSLSVEIRNWDFVAGFVTCNPGSPHQPYSADQMDWRFCAGRQMMRLIPREQRAMKWWGGRKRDWKELGRERDGGRQDRREGSGGKRRNGVRAFSQFLFPRCLSSESPRGLCETLLYKSLLFTWRQFLGVLLLENKEFLTILMVGSGYSRR